MVVITGISGGNVAFDSDRVIMVTVKPACCRAAVIGVPKLPEANREVSRVQYFPLY